MAERGKRTRVCIVMGGHWAAQAGGAQYQAKCLADMLKAREDLEIFYLAHRVPRERTQDGYEIVHFGPGQGVGAAHVLASLPALYLALTRLRPDVVYQRSLMPYTGVCALYCKRHGARFVFHVASDGDVRKPPPTGSLIRRLSRRIAEYGLHRADILVAQTQDQARLLRSEYGLEATAVVPNFHPAPEREVSARVRDRRRVIWVANFKPVKNPELFVELAEQFAGRTDVEFVMIGRGREEPRYRKLFERIARLPNLRYLGELPLEQVNREIAASDILVNTSSTEGFPNTFIQAWLRGVPVVSCWVDPDGCLSGGSAGVLAGERSRLPAVISDLLDDEVKLRRLSEAARAYGHANHHQEKALPLVDLVAGGTYARIGR
jgi:glycosyltransferase involved in cell wall biosynthesis